MKPLKVKSLNRDEASELLKSRLESCMLYRQSKFEAGWKANETTLFLANGSNSLKPTLSYESLAEIYQAQSLDSQKNIHIPKVAQNLRFLHSQMSANPPAVIPKPTSNELEDRRATEAVQDLCTYGRTHYKLHEYIDLTALSTLTYGTGFLKGSHDPHLGEVLKFDKSSGEITMQGDFKCRPVLIWDFWFDRDALVWEDVRFTFERHMMPFTQAVSIWPEHEKDLMQSLVDAQNHPSRMGSTVVPLDSKSHRTEPNTSMVEIYEYTEKGLPENGMAGRRCFHLKDGKILGDLDENPHPNKILPYGILTDMDVPGEIYGKTTVDYAIQTAKVVDFLDSMVLNNISLHGNIKLCVFNEAETNEKSFTDNPVDIISVNGTHAHAPFQMQPASVSNDVHLLRNNLLASIDGIMGVNEILQGQINRELSGFASQTAINAANMVRHRVFKKYTTLVEFIYTIFVDSVRENWKVKRQLKVIGKEDSSTLRYIEGSDIASGYMMTFEYGTNFSLDPALRRDEIMQSREVLLGAGVTDKKIAEMLRYNEVDALFDAAGVARKRQIEIFEKAIEVYEKTGKIKIEPAKAMRKAYHLEMAEAGMEFVMTRDFLGLEPELREAIYKHIEDREKLAAEQAAPPVPQQPGMPGPAGGMPPIPGMPPMPGPIPDIGGVL